MKASGLCRRLLVLSLLLFTLMLPFPPAGAQTETGTVTLVHGLRGLVADVYLEDELVLEGFSPERITDPIELPAGNYEVAIYETGSAPPEEPAISATVEVAAGDDLSGIVHATEDGDPEFSVFSNDVAPVDFGDVRLVVRHLAEAEAFDVLVDGEPIAGGIDPGEESATDISASPHEVAVASQGTSEPIFSPQTIDLPDGGVMILYLVGSGDAGSLGWLAQTVTGPESVPSVVPTGDSGLVAPPAVPWPLILGGLIAMVALLSIGRARRSLPQR